MSLLAILCAREGGGVVVVVAMTFETKRVRALRCVAYVSNVSIVDGCIATPTEKKTTKANTNVPTRTCVDVAF